MNTSITFLQHIGQMGVEKLVPFADNIGQMVNQFAPGVGDTVAKVMKAVGQAEQDAVEQGHQDGSGPQKLASVVAAVSNDVVNAMKKGRTMPSTTIVKQKTTAIVNQAVNALNSIQVVPADGQQSQSDQSEEVSGVDAASTTQS